MKPIEFILLEVFVICVALLIVYYIKQRLNSKKEEVMTSKINYEGSERQNPINTTELLMQTLRNLGCKPSVDEDGDISVEFQGGNFLLRSTSDSPFVWMHFLHCYSCSTNNIPLFSAVRRAINHSNVEHVGNMVYTTNPDTNECFVHIIDRFLFIQQIPNLDAYLSHTMQAVFSKRQNFIEELEKIKVKEGIVEPENNE